MKKEPLYRKIENYLLNLIRINRGDADYLLPSESQLCIKFNASREPIRKAFAELEKSGKIVRKQGKGAYIKHSENDDSAGHSPHLIAIILPEFSTTFAHNIINGVRMFCSDSGNRYVFLPSFISPNEEQANIQLAKQLHCDGVLLMPVDNDVYNDALLRVIIEKTPCIFLDRKLVGLTIPSVSSDHTLMGYRATVKLLDRGCDKIAFFAFSDQITSVNERVQGYRKALAEKGITDEYAVNIMWINEQMLRENLQMFLQTRPEINGIILSSGKIAASAIYTLQKLGKKIGEDIHMVVFDEDNALINTTMDIVTDAIVQDGFRIGYTAAQLLIRQIEQHEIPPQQTFVPLLQS